MPYQGREQIDTPSNDTIIWRYMSLEYFESLIDSQKLYLCPISKYLKDDPWEAAIPLSGLQWRHEKLLEAEAKGKEELEKVFKEIVKLEGFREQFTHSVKVSCWHISNHESEAMWKLYNGSEFGVAIQSTVGKLISSISKAEEEIFIGNVKYIDYETDSFNDIQWFEYCYHKRNSFSHENELRLSHFNSTELLLQNQNPSGDLIEIDPKELIGQVLVSPFDQEKLDKINTKLSSMGMAEASFSKLLAPPYNGFSLFKFGES